jgi:hypothetical protein
LRVNNEFGCYPPGSCCRSVALPKAHGVAFVGQQEQRVAHGRQFVVIPPGEEVNLRYDDRIGG